MLRYLNKDLATYDIHGQLAAIKTPALIIHCEAEAIPIEAVRKIHEQIGGSEFIVLKDCGHFPYIEAPEDFLRAVRNFLNELPNTKGDEE